MGPWKRDDSLPIERLLTGVEVAEILGISRRSVWRLGIDGDLPTFRVGKIVRYRKSDIEAWIAKHTKRGLGGRR